MTTDTASGLPRTTELALARLGYEWRLFGSTARTLRKSLMKEGSHWQPAWSEIFSGNEAGTLASQALYVTLSEDGSCPQIALTPRGTEPESLPVEVARLDAETALHLSWLRVPSLRARWERLLRRNHLDSLLNVLPEAWVLDPDPVPPGAVIRGLGLATWCALPALRGSRDFFLLAAHGECLRLDAKQNAAAWSSAVSQALAGFPRQTAFLISAPTGARAWLAEYMDQQGRVTLKSSRELPVAPL